MGTILMRRIFKKAGLRTYSSRHSLETWKKHIICTSKRRVSGTSREKPVWMDINLYVFTHCYPRHRCEICADVVASGHGNSVLQLVSSDPWLFLVAIRLTREV